MHRSGTETSNNVKPPTTTLTTISSSSSTSNSVSSNYKSPITSSKNMVPISGSNIQSGTTIVSSPSISEAIINASKPIINSTTNNIIGLPISTNYKNNHHYHLPTTTTNNLSSPRKELGPSIRPSNNIINKDINKEIGPTSTTTTTTTPTTGLIHSRSGSNLLSRNTYDCKIAGLYDLEETLGRGHFAVVKLARHVFTGEKVAVKVIDKTKLDEVSRAHLFQEVRCMKLVQHPNVVRLYEVIDTQTKLYLILELADGGDLYDYIMRHDEGLGEDQARNYFRQIVHAISYCHKLHVVHRDLKPENVVFFERLGMVKLTDFGFSNRFNPGQKLETSCGSLAYSAPEILLGDSYDAPAVDVWSLGVILYMLVCGHAPFQEANDSETLTMIMDCKYSTPAYISPACKKLISRMLVREPERRATLEELASDPWLLEGSGMQPAEYLPLISREHVSEEDHNHILQKMVNGKIATKEEILEALDKNEYNHITATYFLLAERKLRAHRQEQAQKAAGISTTTIAMSPATTTLGSSSGILGSPSPLLLSPGSPGDLILAKPVKLQPSTTISNRLPISSQPSALLSVPSESAQTVARGRKCSIVTEEEDDEENEDSGHDSSSRSSCHSLLNRRGSRSEGKLSLALQERLAEARIKEPRPVTAVPPKPCPRYHKAPIIARINTQLTSAATVSIPVITNTSIPSPSKFKTLPTPSRPLHSVCSSPQLTLNEIFEEGTEKVNITTPVPVVPRVVVTRQKFHKNRTASCSSSDASDEDSESRKKRAHKLKTLPGNSRRRDSHDDSSDSQGGQGGGGGGNSGGGSGSPENTSVNESNDKQQQSSSSGGNNNGRRHTGFRRRCGTAGETRLRESQSLNRITEVQESSESLVQTLQNTATVTTAATSPRSRRSFGARFLLLVGGNKKSSSSSSSSTTDVVEKENCSTPTTNKTKITRYFHLHRKLCLPIFKPNSTTTTTTTTSHHNHNNHHHHHHHHSATNINNNNSASSNDVWLGASKHG